MMAKVKQEIDIVINGKGSAPQFIASIEKGMKGMAKGGGIAQQAKAWGIGGDSSVFNMLKGGGALMGVSMITNQLNSVAEQLPKWAESLKHGGSKSEILGQVLAEAVPVAGGLAKSIRGLIDSSDALKFAQLDAAKDAKRASDERQKRLGDFRKGVTDEFAAMGAAGRESSLRDQFKDDFAWRGHVIEKQMEDEVNAMRKRLTETMVKLSPDEQAIVRKNANDAIRGIEAERNRSRVELNKDIEVWRKQQEAMREATGKFIRETLLDVPKGLARSAGGAAGNWLSGVGGVLGDILGGVRGGGGARSQFSGGLAPGEESRFLTGVGAAGRENNPTLMEQKKQTKTLGEIADGISDLVKRASSAVGGLPIFNG